ncbi:helix-turn-helix domain-containing protein [Streptomyces sp. NPDC056437]|uniref:helix-turn-helix domain-containing protein n=1 Tax=Streptomyces sp. NPDC056437 TaxID=3345816 RepID=UPI0036A2E8A5
MGIGELIRELRTARGWSQGRLVSELNDAFGTSLTWDCLSRWENGKVKPSAFYLAHLSSLLDVPLAVLEGEVDRRTFLTDVAGAAIAPAVASDLLTVGFSARPNGGPSVDAWEDKLATYGTEYMSLGAADIQRLLACRDSRPPGRSHA